MPTTAKYHLVTARDLLNKALDHVSRAADDVEGVNELDEEAEGLFEELTDLIAATDRLAGKL
jgi:hypothetical protein